MRTDLGDVAVLDAGGLVQMFPLDPLGGEAAAGDGRPAAEGLELGVNNLSVVINLSRENLSININAPTKYNPLMYSKLLSQQILKTPISYFMPISPLLNIIHYWH